jgi:hypothetical protein
VSPLIERQVEPSTGKNAARFATSAVRVEPRTCECPACSATFPVMSNRVRLALLLAALLLAPVSRAATTTAKSAPAKSATSAWHPVVPFIEDDFGRALALAKERKLPVFIEGWAPW